MKYTFKHNFTGKEHFDSIMACVDEKDALLASAQYLNEQSQGLIKRALKEQWLGPKVGNVAWVYTSSMACTSRVLLVRVPPQKSLSARHFLKIAEASMSAIAALRDVRNVCCCLHELSIATEEHDGAWKTTQLILALERNLYRFNDFKTKSPAPASALKDLVFYAESSKALQDAVTHTTAIVKGMNHTKNLGNLPGNVCTPTHLAKEAQALAKQHRALRVNVLEEREMQKLGMGALLSVSRGSEEPPKLIVIEHKPAAAKNKKPIVFVGKGITFDSGGISIKPGAAMDEMKYDMCGAASVLGTMEALATMALPLHVIGVMACSENLPDGRASKPGDIVKTMSGQTVEILNTDAEGRLVLCDALTYCEKFDPEVVIDIATLTGAIIVALGSHTTGLMTTDTDLEKALRDAGETVDDRLWPLPVWDEYQDAIDSPFADMANIGDRGAGSITAACFLSRFTKKFRWAHLDIAGTAWRGGKNKGATGRPVPLLCQYLLDYGDTQKKKAPVSRSKRAK